MYKRLEKMSPEACIEIGRRILPRLQADPRLAPAATELATGQSALEAAHATHTNRVQEARSARAVKDDVSQALSDTLREFGLAGLGVTRNRHDQDPYLRYFPTGYGEVRRMAVGGTVEFAGILLAKLAEESDPRLIVYRERLTTVHATASTAIADWEGKARAETEAEQFQEIRIREWVASLSRSRLLAEGACLAEQAYIRSIYRPASNARRGTTARADSGESPAPVAAASSGTTTQAAGTGEAGAAA